MHLPQPVRNGRQFEALHQFGTIALDRRRIIPVGSGAIAHVEMIERR
jgi:hypothetical protein